MRLNKYIALATGLSRRAADDAIAAGRVQVGAQHAKLGDQVTETDTVAFDGKLLKPPEEVQTIMLNKPAGYVCSRDGQGNKTIYELLPAKYHALKPVGRLDKDSSGLLLLTNNGTLAFELTHPSFQKEKHYEVTLDHALSKADLNSIAKEGVRLADGASKLGLSALNNDNTVWKVTMAEGRNRQIRRTFEALGYTVTKLHRTHLGSYTLDALKSGSYTEI